MSSEAECLFLCRTPLQARICLEIIKKNAISSFDVIYFTQNNSPADQNYFTLLKINASHALYLFVPIKKPDLFNLLTAIWRYRSLWKHKNYEFIYLASLDSLLFRAAVGNSLQAEIISFDDGLANITPGDHLANPGRYKKACIYGWLLGLPGQKKIMNQIRRHYSIYPEFNNIIKAQRTIYLSLFDNIVPPSPQDDNQKTIFFIGQPFQEYLSPSQIDALKRWVKINPVDYYLIHPRELAPLFSDVSILDNKGQLAEDAILFAARHNRPCIISAYSSVLFNISSSKADKVYLSLGDSADEQHRLSLIYKTGATVIKVQ